MARKTPRYADGRGNLIVVEHERQQHDVGIVAFGYLHSTFEKVRLAEVVGIAAVKVVAPGNLDGAIAGFRRAGVTLGDDFDARVGAGVVGKYGRGCVCRAVVDADELDVCERLRQEGVDALWQVGLFVEDRDDDRNPGMRAKLLCSLCHHCLH